MTSRFGEVPLLARRVVADARQPVSDARDPPWVSRYVPRASRREASSSDAGPAADEAADEAFRVLLGGGRGGGARLSLASSMASWKVAAMFGFFGGTKRSSSLASGSKGTMSLGSTFAVSLVPKKVTWDLSLLERAFAALAGHHGKPRSLAHTTSSDACMDTTTQNAGHKRMYYDDDRAHPGSPDWLGKEWWCFPTKRGTATEARGDGLLVSYM